MTVNTTTNKVIFSMDGSTVNFDFTFEVLQASDIKATIKDTTTNTETELTYTTGTPSSGQYTVAINSNGVGGTVTVGNAQTSDYELTIYREVDGKQESDYNNYNTFPAETLEDDLDKRAMADQQQDEAIARSIKGSITVQGVDYTLPAPEASKVIGYNSAGTGLQNYTNAAVSSEEAAASAAAAAASAAAAAASADAANGTQETFTNSDLSSGVLTITHNLNLDAPYGLYIEIINNNSFKVSPDQVTFSANSFQVDISSSGTISGTWAVVYGGAPQAPDITVPDPSSGTEGDRIVINGSGAYELETKAALFDWIHPVGSIYENKTDSRNPNTIFGYGTWEAIEGLVTAGYKNGDSNFGTPGATVGVAEVTLTAAQSGLPAHTHTYSQPVNEDGGGSGEQEVQNTTSGTTGSTGGTSASEAHTNIQPTLVVYKWLRTA